jgi:hypothetical protein
MNLPKELTTVTPVSKIVALIMFITLPIIAFFFGMRYQTLLNAPVARQACTEEAKLCPDGVTSVARSGPNCEFDPCPLVENSPKTFSGIVTSISYGCHMDGECNVGVGKDIITIEKGEGPQGTAEIRGTYPEGMLDTKNLNLFLKKTAEVYAKKINGKFNTYTLYGDARYYIKIQSEETGALCGGIAGRLCADGYYCKYDGTYPDAGGTCLKSAESNTKTGFICPKTQWVDCMPGPGKAKKTECSPEFLQWAQKNCPGFQGAAL